MRWTDERVEMLKRLWADGLAASQIAGELGGVTRNGVIGKVHRLGLSGRVRRSEFGQPKKQRKQRTDRRPLKAVPTPEEKAAAMKRYAAAEAATRALAAGEEPAQELIDTLMPVKQRRTLLELTEDTCRWPIGDPGTAEFFFCGAKPVEYVVDVIGSKEIKKRFPYCNYHSRVAYQPASDRRNPKPPFRENPPRAA